nr:uncharacterized protein LOC122268899 [Parasteatoda tepidariorum]
MAARFQVDWLHNPEFKDWVKEVESDNHRAKCVVCHSTFSLSNMGHRALRSHAKSAQHVKRMKAMQGTLPLKFFTSDNGKAPSIESSNKTIESGSSSVESLNDPILSTPSTRQGLESFLLRDDVTKAEILWCLHTVVTHKSVRMLEKDVELFQLLFPDSKIAKSIKLKKSKIAYSILYGIAPYFKTELITNISKCEFFTVGFDESLRFPKRLRWT